MPKEEPARSAEAARRVFTDLVRLTRYEARAVARRERAIREMVKILPRKDFRASLERLLRNKTNS